MAADPSVVEMVRRQDRGRFVAGLFAPAAKRDALIALYALNQELGRIPGAVSEPMLGRIRLQWWRERIAAMAAGGPSPAGHPLGQAIAGLVAETPAVALDPLISARESALDGASPAETAARVGPALADAALDVLEVADPTTRAAAREAGAAYELAGLAASGPDEGAHALHHLRAARGPADAIDRRALSVLLWATVAERRLRQPHAPGPPVFRLLWNALRGRY